jgi:hypothetical protein
MSGEPPPVAEQQNHPLLSQVAMPVSNSVDAGQRGVSRHSEAGQAGGGVDTARSAKCAVADTVPSAGKRNVHISLLFEQASDQNANLIVGLDMCGVRSIVVEPATSSVHAPGQLMPGGLLVIVPLGIGESIVTFTVTGPPETRRNESGGLSCGVEEYWFNTLATLIVMSLDVGNDVLGS